MGFFTTDTTTIWPHELFAGIFKHHRAAFQKYILGGQHSNIKDFWKIMPPRAGMTRKARWNELCIPLALHGDGVSVSNIRGKASKSVDAISWTSLLASGPSRLTVFLVWFCMAHLTKRTGFAQTWTGFWRRMCKSLRALWEGVWPTEDMQDQPDPRAGQPLAGGYCAIIYSNRGDLEWLTKHFFLRSVSSTMPCSLCNCTNHGQGRDVVPWTDTNDPPTWLEHCVDDQVGKYQHKPWVQTFQ